VSRLTVAFEAPALEMPSPDDWLARPAETTPWPSAEQRSERQRLEALFAEADREYRKCERLRDEAKQAGHDAVQQRSLAYRAWMLGRERQMADLLGRAWTSRLYRNSLLRQAHQCRRVGDRLAAQAEQLEAEMQRRTLRRTG
jgi:hypothetical protein